MSFLSNAKISPDIQAVVEKQLSQDTVSYEASLSDEDSLSLTGLIESAILTMIDLEGNPEYPEATNPLDFIKDNPALIEILQQFKFSRIKIQKTSNGSVIISEKI